MSRIQWRLRPLLFTATAALVAVVLLVAERAAEFAVRRGLDGGAGAEVLRDLRLVYLALALLALAAVFALATILGRKLAEPLRQLRAATSARERGERNAFNRSDVAELNTAVAAVERLAGELERRSERVAGERDELALLLNSVSEGILQIDANGRIAHANPAASALLGLRANGAGQPVASFIRDPALRAIIERAAAGVSVPASEVTLDERRLLVAARPFAHAGREGHSRAGAVIAFTDFTELRRLEGVRRDFVANVSHELKTPLTSIRGYVETLLSDDLPLDMQRQFLEVIQKNAQRLHGIVDDLLDLSRLESGGWRPELTSIDALDLTRDVWSSVQDRMGGKRIDFTARGESVSVTADPAGLRQVLSNLFDNAIRHTPDHGRIAAQVTRVADRVAIEISDTGSGIPRDDLPRIFERFYRVDPARSRAEGGTGLGLSIVRHLVESMHGEVTAESELGKGTTLRVWLPAAHATTDLPRPES